MSNVSPITNAYDGLQGGTPKVQTHFNCEALWIKETEFALVKSGSTIVIGTHPNGASPASGVGATASVLIGYNGAAAVTTGWGNTIIGANVAPTLVSGNNNILIGTGAASTTDVTNSTASNEFHLGGSTVSVMRALGINTPTLSFFLDWVPNSTSYTTDAAAAVGGVLVGQIYRNGSVVQCRIA